MRARTTVVLTALALGIAGCGTGVGSPDGSGGTASGGTVACRWSTDDGPASVDADQPPDDVPATGTGTLRMTTGQGALVLTLDRAPAPCAAAALTSLAEQGFFDGSPCHRETDSAGLQVLKCGDPTGTGTGGPPWSYPTDVDGTESYPRGTIAMANSGQGSDGSQFFLVWGDAQLTPDYTVVGTVDDDGLAVLDAIAERGNDGSNGPGDGAPTDPVTIETMAAG